MYKTDQSNNPAAWVVVAGPQTDPSSLSPGTNSRQRKVTIGQEATSL